MVRSISIGSLLVFLLGCATTDPFPVLETGEPVLEHGSLVYAGMDGNLYVVEARADEVIRITSNARLATSEGEASLRYSGFVWAGDRVVYTTQESDGSGAISTSLYAVDPGARPVRVFSQDGYSPFFLYPTRDGSRVGYLGSEAGSGGLLMGSVDLDSKERVVHGRGQPFYSAWSPDGGGLITHVGAPGSRTGSVLGIQVLGDGTELASARRLELPTGPFQTPDYSPDGSRIAVVLRRAESPGIHILTAAGDELGRLVSLVGSASSLAWAPNGNSLAYIDGLATPIGALVGRLYVARLGSDRPRLVSEAAIAHFWSPDSTKLLFFEPFVAPGSNGESIAYRVQIFSALDGSVSTLATLRPAPAFAQQIIPFVDQYERAYTIWSPDSRLVALNSVAANGNPVIHLVDTENLSADDAFRVSFTRAQDSERAELLGMVPADGVRSRVLAAGILPFFSSE